MAKLICARPHDQVYRCNSLPDIYAVTMKAFRYIRKLYMNNSILVSGKSDAGKTKAVVVMGYVGSLAANVNSKPSSRSEIVYQRQN